MDQTITHGKDYSLVYPLDRQMTDIDKTKQTQRKGEVQLCTETVGRNVLQGAAFLLLYFDYTSEPVLFSLLPE